MVLFAEVTMDITGQHKLLKFNLSINALNSFPEVMGMRILLFFYIFPVA